MTYDRYGNAAIATVTSATAADDGLDSVEYVNGVLTVTKRTAATGDAVTADATGAAIAVANSVQLQKEVVAAAKVGVQYYTNILAAATADAGTGNTSALLVSGAYAAVIDTATTNVAIAKAALAAEQKKLDLILGGPVDAVAAGDITAYSGYDFNAGLSGTSDNGITFAAGFDMGAGQLSDIANNALVTQSATIGAPTVSASMNGYTVAFSADGIDDLYDDSQNGDVSVAGTIGGVTFKVVHDLEEDTAASAATFKAASGNAGDANYKAATFTDAVKAVYNTTSYTLGTTVGGVGLALTGTDANDEGLSAMKAKATYVMDALTFGIESNNRGDSTKKLNANKVSVAYAGEGVSASVSSNDDKDWDLSATLSAGANSATFATDEESAWDAKVASDLGGGASVFGYVDHTELFMAGVRFKF